MLEVSIRFRGNTKRGGTKQTAALMPHKAVVLLPRSPLDIFRTCRVLEGQIIIIFPGFVTVVKPVSSQFHTRVALQIPDCSVVFKKEKTL